MKKAAFLLVLATCCTLWAYASHIYGGEMIYTYLGPGSGANTNKYRITLKLFRDNLGGGAELPREVWITVFDYGTRKAVPAPNSQNFHVVPITRGPSPVGLNVQPCVSGDISGSYSVGEYEFEVDLPINTQGYVAAYETCCRVNGLANVFHPGTSQGGAGGTGSTYMCRIPGTNLLPAGEVNSSPEFQVNLDLVCYERPFSWNFSATDKDGDQLVYSFTPGFDKSFAENSGNVVPASPGDSPYYPLLDYINGYTSGNPLGNRARIDAETGIIQGVAPPMGKYVVAVLVKEFRNGKQIGEHRKDFILRVQNCEIAAAQLQPEYVTCDGFNYTFKNEAPPSPLIRSYYWDFGVAGTDTDISTDATPTYIFPDTGTYTVRLFINKGEACENVAETKVKVYPGFTVDFSFAGICQNRVTQFTDRTVAEYGQVDSWVWNLGEPNAPDNISEERNPRFTYTSLGTRRVSLTATSDKGCVATVTKDVEIMDRPLLTVAFADTLICTGDRLQLQAEGLGNFTWTPGTGITNANTATPTVNPTATTEYFVELDYDGCKARDTVQVRVVNFVTVIPMTDTTICAGDALNLKVETDGLQFAWAPAATLDDPNSATPVARPGGTTTYTVTSTIGGCSTQDDITVRTVPYPLADAGADTIICYNTAVQLNGRVVGNSFSWSPAGTLSSTAVLNPLARPQTSTAYVLTARDNIGCPKPGRDTVIVDVLPEVSAFAGRDTAVVVGQPLQLLATGGDNFVWSPADNLNNPFIPDPIATFDGSQELRTYLVEATDALGCSDTASVRIRVFRTDPRIFVPTAFSPNGDGRNDQLRFVSAGITNIEYFRIFNRWGQLVYDSPIEGRGWDGRIQGQLQGSGTYVWMVRGTDYTGREILSKGTVTLVR